MTETRDIGGNAVVAVRNRMARLLRLEGRSSATRRPWRAAEVLPPYTPSTDTGSHRLIAALKMIGLALLCVIYGMAIAFFAGSAIAVLPAPVFVLLGLVFWALPDTRTAPIRLMGVLFFATMITMAIWPNYLALALPGLPWITFSRVADGPLVLVFLYCLSTSKTLRRDLIAIVGATPLIWKLLIGFVAIQALSIGFSSSPLVSIEKFILAQLSWTATFFIAAYVFAQKGAATKWAGLLWAFAIFQGVLSVLEHARGHVLWIDSIPSFLQISDPVVQAYLSPKYRGYHAQYRAQGTFNGPLQLGQFISLCFVFVMHFAVEGRTARTRLLARFSVPFLLAVSLATGSRSSAGAFLVAMALYSLYLGARWWRRHPSGLVAPLFILSYPLLGLVAFASTFFVGHLRAKIWGTGSTTAASSQGRVEQYNLGIPKIMHRPWGYGIGRGAETLGWLQPDGSLSIDSYFLTLSLEYGVIGLIVYLTMFLYAAAKAVWSAMMNTAEDWETTLLAPAGISLIGFIVVKAVFSEDDNHFFFFAVLGMVVGLLWRRSLESSADPVEQPAMRSRHARRRPPGLLPVAPEASRS